MTLENLVRIGKLKRHAADKRDIARLLASAESAIRDAKTETLSAASRLDLSYRAIMQGSLVAMLASGFRPSTSEAGHHQLLVQALPKTIGLPSERARILDAFRAARNKSDYDGVSVSDAMALEAVEEAERLLSEVKSWLKAEHAELG
jgi:hypothetical protein